MTALKAYGLAGQVRIVFSFLREGNIFNEMYCQQIVSFAVRV